MLKVPGEGDMVLEDPKATPSCLLEETQPEKDRTPRSARCLCAPPPALVEV